MAGWSLYNGLDDTNIQNAKAYANGVYDVFEATIEERGYQYTGDCATWGHGIDYKECDAGEAVDTNCAWTTTSKYPLAATATARRLMATGAGEECQHIYTPWLVVSFEADGKKVKRCAYTYGTKKNSGIHRWEVAEGFHNTAAPTKVWVDPTRCVVGVWDRSEIVAIEERIDEHHLGMGYFTATISVSCLLCAFYNMCCKAGGKGEEDEELLERGGLAEETDEEEGPIQ
jgi:hypothetical protein